MIHLIVINTAGVIWTVQLIWRTYKNNLIVHSWRKTLNIYHEKTAATTPIIIMGILIAKMIANLQSECTILLWHTFTMSSLYGREHWNLSWTTMHQANRLSIAKPQWLRLAETFAPRIFLFFPSPYLYFFFSLADCLFLSFFQNAHFAHLNRYKNRHFRF